MPQPSYSHPSQVVYLARPASVRRCLRCRADLYAADTESFAGTAFAEDTHNCTLAKKVLAEAQRGADMFERHHEFVHARLIVTPGVTTRAWLRILQDSTPHQLRHWALALPSTSYDVIVSTHITFVPDLRQVAADMAEQMRAAWNL